MWKHYYACSTGETFFQPSIEALKKCLLVNDSIQYCHINILMITIPCKSTGNHYDVAQTILNKVLIILIQ